MIALILPPPTPRSVRRSSHRFKAVVVPTQMDTPSTAKTVPPPAKKWAP